MNSQNQNIYQNPSFDLKSYLKVKREKINLMLHKIVKEYNNSSMISKAMNYSLMAGGKRVRPILCVAAAEAAGGNEDQVIREACALEMIHTYSLIHDDLPAMDNDDLRRGIPTCHAAFDEPTAILAGDALLTMAIEVLSTIHPHQSQLAASHLEIIRIISKAAGPTGMIEGQMRDMTFQGNKTELKELEALHRLKTGALINASIHSGAILAGATDSQIEDLKEYADNLGLAFQVSDDILNVEGDPTLMGKAVGTDKQRKKAAYPSLMGNEKSKVFAKKLVINALKSIDNFDKKADPLRAIAFYVIERKR